jgi:outer membrane protein assembly factor BamB
MRTPSPPARLLHWTVLVVLGTVAPLYAADAPFWPRFHGPNSDNRSTETGLLKQWPDRGPRLLWTAKGIGDGFATVAIAGGLLYTDGSIGDQTVITALDLDGTIRWQVPNGRAWTGQQPGTRGTPTIDGDRLYHESPLGEVVCLDARTGKRIWGSNILTKFGGKIITWALAESLLIDGDRVICCPGGPETAVVALDKATGRTVWKSPSAGDLAGYSSPVLAEHDGLRMILTMTSRASIGVNADTGDLLWRHEHITPFDENICTPIFRDGWVFTSTGHRVGSVMLKVAVSGRKASVKEVWKSVDLDSHHGGVVLLDGYLYGSRWTPQWVCLDWKTGKTMYEERGVGKGSLTYADGMLYTVSEQGLLGLVKATPHGHKVISQFRLPAGGEGPVWAHPVVCGGRLYIRHGDFLYAYDIKK